MLTNDAINLDALPADAAVRRDQVLQFTGYSRTTLWRRIRAKQFPAPSEDGGIKVWTAGQVRQALATLRKSAPC